MKILIVEDDRLLNSTLCYNLSYEDNDIDSALDIRTAEKLLEKNRYDLAILDVNMPDGNGFDLCKNIKVKYSDTAVIFLTANDLESDMLKGYELGADDYVTKPFHVSVFKKKVAALLTRIQKREENECYKDKHIFIDFTAMRATVGENDLSLTPLEYRLLKVLTANYGQVLTRQLLLEKLWDIDENYVDEHALTSAISRIRSKIEDKDNHYIKTVYGMGYIWVGGMSDG